MKDFFIELFEYNHYHNQLVADRFAIDLAHLSEKITKLYSHILNAHHIWISRIEADKNSLGVWDVHDPESGKRIDKRNHEKTIMVLNNQELNSTIQYSNTKGQAYHNTIRDILFHIINHSTYHRAQIAMEMRLTGLEPITTDYIFYKR